MAQKSRPIANVATTKQIAKKKIKSKLCSKTNAPEPKEVCMIFQFFLCTTVFENSLLCHNEEMRWKGKSLNPTFRIPKDPA